jgi:hypothetical protein
MADGRRQSETLQIAKVFKKVSTRFIIEFSEVQTKIKELLNL